MCFVLRWRYIIMGPCDGVNIKYNSTNETHQLYFSKDYESAHSFVYYCEAVIIPVINLLAVITNSCTLVILPKTRIVNAFKICLISLTICDLMASLISFVNLMIEIGFYDGDIPFGFWEPAAITCYVLYYISSVFICASATYVIAIVAIRHWIVNSPVKARVYLTSANTKNTCLYLFLAVLVLYLPTCLNIMYQSCSRDVNTTFCIEINEAIPNLKEITSFYVYSLTLLFGPIFVIMYIVSIIGIKTTLARSSRDLDTLSHSDLSKQSKKIRRQKTARITTLLLVILIADTICTLPICIQAIAITIAPEKTVFCPTNVPYKMYDAIAEIFLYLRPAYNFWLYSFQHKEFRCEAMKMFSFIRFFRHDSYDQSMSSSSYYKPKGCNRPSNMLSQVSTISQL